MKSTLVREKLAIPVKEKIELEPSIRELSIKSRTVLGYKTLHNLITEKKTLKAALIELDIQPFSLGSVRSYQNKMKSKLQKEFNRQRQQGMRKKLADWNTHDISCYSEPVPEFVLNKAIQIKEALPEVRFMVESLGEKSDPFLIAVLGDERYYIEVWDEPQFENKVLRGLHVSNEMESNAGGDYDDEEDSSEASSSE